VPELDHDKPSPDPRDEPFGYVCHRCTKCCRDKRIQLNPYEVARLARNCGLTTGEFRAAWTEAGAGLALRQTESGACVFLDSEGCTVHPDRPLVCRLYPLGRHVSIDGAEWFSHLDPIPHSRGEYTRAGKIADFLVSQHAQPFIEAADDYFFWLCAASERAAETAGGETANISSQDGNIALELLDMDGAITRHCEAAEIAEPIDIEARKRLHLKILYQKLETIMGGSHA
jgi:uncharacterized protein